ncbi:MAG: hypothetical protein HRT74_11880 [Flavobacteriales bacterium]|nr:hypothetical protein [Flavobacteriales bacterium]
MLFRFLMILIVVSVALKSNAQETFFVNHDGLDREYTLYQPLGDGPFPLVFCLHGYTNNATFQMEYSAFNEVADQEGFMVIYPQGTNDDLGIPFWNAWMAEDSADDVGFIDYLIDLAIENHDADASKIYSCGFSNGGIMSYTLACELSHRIAAVASVAGTMNAEVIEDCDLDQPFPVMHIHGDLDLVVPIDGNELGDITDFGVLISAEETLTFWNDLNNAEPGVTTDIPNESILDFCTAEYTSYSWGDGKENAFILVEGGGHTWPGGFPLVVVGNTNQDFSASEEIWEFFSQYELEGDVVGIQDYREIEPEEIVAYYSLNGQVLKESELSGFYVALLKNGKRKLYRRSE